MSNQLLKGKKGIIFGALDENSIAWKVAERCYEEGAQFILTNAPIALRMGGIQQLAERTGAELFPCDVTVEDDMNALIDKAIELYGKVDFILHSVGMSLNIRKKKPYTGLNYDFMHKTLDISAISLHRLLQTCYAKDAIREWGSVVCLTYIAAQRVFPDYSEMAESKALLESITRSFGYHYGMFRKVRVNSISQSPTMTTAGSGVGGFDAFLDFAEKMSPLGNADALSCADYCVTMFSDLTRMVTMQNLYHDGGYSNMGVSEIVMSKFGDPNS
ncbi:MAG: SDR family oxidoreductase [Flavobacteriales bacterium]|nr:SDR family oxidoreductase [Flavobacteriales bacterium]